MRLLLSYAHHHLFPPAFSFPSIATTSLGDQFLESSTWYGITRIRLVRVGLPRPFSLNHSFRYETIAGRTHRISTGPGHSLLDCSTSMIVHHHSYRLASTIRGKGAVGKARKHDINRFQHMANGTAVYSKGRLRTANLGPCPHVYASHLFLVPLMTLTTHLYPLGLSPSHVLQLRTFGVQPDVTPCRTMHGVHPPRNRRRTFRPIVPT